MKACIGDNMLSIIIILVNITVTVLSIYIFDYLEDGIVNNIFVIILSLLGGVIVTALLVVLFLEVFYLLLPKRKVQKSMFTHKILKQILSVPIHFSRMKLKIVGKENLPKDSGFSIYANHSSWIDTPIIVYGLYDNPVGAIGKDGAFNIPIIGKFAPKFGGVMIFRENPRQSAEAIKQVITNVKNGFSMLIFPEGTRSPHVNSLLDFKPGAFKVALRSGKPLVPITIVKPINYRKIKWPFIKRVTLIIHKPLSFDDFKTMKSLELSSKVRKIIDGPFNKIDKDK